MSTRKVTELTNYAKGLNIEGGWPHLKLIKDNPKKIIGQDLFWVNLILVLDTPLETNIVFDDLLKDTTYPMLENRIDEINEHHFLAGFLLVIQYYIEHGKSMLAKKWDDPLNLTICIHQDESTCQPLIELIDYHVQKLIMSWKVVAKAKKTINIRYLADTPIFVQTSHSYGNTDIMISLSQCAGMQVSGNHGPGTLLVADTFLPFSIDYQTVYQYAEYNVQNNLIHSIDYILESPLNEKIVKYINKNYKSVNPSKNNFKAHILTKDDFKVTKILQVDKLWNPKDKEEVVTII